MKVSTRFGFARGDDYSINLADGMKDSLIGPPVMCKICENPLGKKKVTGRVIERLVRAALQLNTYRKKEMLLDGKTWSKVNIEKIYTPSQVMQDLATNKALSDEDWAKVYVATKHYLDEYSKITKPEDASLLVDSIKNMLEGTPDESIVASIPILRTNLAQQLQDKEESKVMVYNSHSQFDSVEEVNVASAASTENPVQDDVATNFSEIDFEETELTVSEANELLKGNHHYNLTQGTNMLQVESLQNNLVTGAQIPFLDFKQPDATGKKVATLGMGYMIIPMCTRINPATPKFKEQLVVICAVLKNAVDANGQLTNAIDNTAILGLGQLPGKGMITRHVIDGTILPGRACQIVYDKTQEQREAEIKANNPGYNGLVSAGYSVYDLNDYVSTELYVLAKKEAQAELAKAGLAEPGFNLPEIISKFGNDNERANVQSAVSPATVAAAPVAPVAPAAPAAPAAPVAAPVAPVAPAAPVAPVAPAPVAAPVAPVAPVAPAPVAAPVAPAAPAPVAAPVAPAAPAAPVAPVLPSVPAPGAAPVIPNM